MQIELKIYAFSNEFTKKVNKLRDLNTYSILKHSLTCQSIELKRKI